VVPVDIFVDVNALHFEPIVDSAFDLLQPKLRAFHILKLHEDAAYLGAEALLAGPYHFDVPQLPDVLQLRLEVVSQFLVVLDFHLALAIVNIRYFDYAGHLQTLETVRFGLQSLGAQLNILFLVCLLGGPRLLLLTRDHVQSFQSNDSGLSAGLGSLLADFAHRDKLTQTGASIQTFKLGDHVLRGQLHMH
jgi:hypothetical protein